MSRRLMTPQDSIWLEIDQPTNLMAITSLLWTATPVDPARLRALIADRLVARYPVFRQRPVLRGGPVRWAYWTDDPDFDLDRHVTVRPMPGAGDLAALQDYVGAACRSTGRTRSGRCICCRGSAAGARSSSGTTTPWPTASG